MLFYGSNRSDKVDINDFFKKRPDGRPVNRIFGIDFGPDFSIISKNVFYKKITIFDVDSKYGIKKKLAQKFSARFGPNFFSIY